MELTIVDNDVIHNYVSPPLCSDLMYAGFAAPCKFFWKVYEKDIILNTHLFDIDDYYKNGNEVTDTMPKLIQILPAFTIKEIEKYLPDFCVCRVNNKYQLSIDALFNVEAITDTRLPDAFAKMMLAALKNRVVKITDIKKIK